MLRWNCAEISIFDFDDLDIFHNLKCVFLVQDMWFYFPFWVFVPETILPKIRGLIKKYWWTIFLIKF